MDRDCLDRPFHFITVVWGRAYCETFLEYCVASWLSPGNLPALATRQKSKFLIATLPEDWAFMSSTPIFSKLKEYVEPVFIEIPPCPPGKSGCEHMGVGHKAACQMAHRARAYGIVFTPDCMISDGTVRALQKHAASGVELVWVPALRFAQESFLAHLRAWNLIADEERRQTGHALTISGAEMVRAAVNGLHTETMSYEWGASYFPALPSAVWWRVPGENGMVVHALSWAPFLLDFAAIKSHDTTTLENWTIDGDYVFKNLGAAPKIHLVRDSDEMFYASWAPLDDRPVDLKPRFTSKWQSVNFLAKAVQFRSAFYGSVFDPLKRQMFVYPARWHANPINAKWRAVEKKSRRRLRFVLHWGVVINGLLACYKYLTGFCNTWEEYQERGRARARASDYVGAAEDFTKAIRIGPQNAALNFLLGAALVQVGDHQGALAEFEAGLKLDPANVTLKSLADTERWTIEQERPGPPPRRREDLLKRSWTKKWLFRLCLYVGCLKAVVRVDNLITSRLNGWRTFRARRIRRVARRLVLEGLRFSRRRSG